ncbi:MAG: DNA polymerase III subunit gamma/tau [Steroidobacteraceae bacterium]
MSYTALARKWRPRTFEEMAGQEHVLRALTNALREGRVHHAFLFTGTRGVGKTTVARIFAKCLNCETGVTATPCGECSACQDIDAGRFVDLIEVDAASRTKVEDTRDLLENVQYMPSRGRYKVYLIDEVHMLSQHSFNALLKTLEEPPPHVKFLLATTDPQRLPVTVLSRCLQFNLKRLPAALIADRLAHILAAEGIAAEAAALRLLAVAADGSLRDALSLLDQLLAFGNGGVTEADARSMLGTVDRQQVLGLARALAQGQPAALLGEARALEQWSPDYAQLLDELLSLLAQVALYQTTGSVFDEEGDVPAEALAQLAGAIAAEDLQLYYQIGLLGRRDLPFAADARSAFAMTLLRMLVFRPGTESLPGAAPASARMGASADGSGSGGTAAVPRTGAAAIQTGAAGDALPFVPENWSRIVSQLEISGLARQLATHCALLERRGAVLQLQLDPRSQSIRSAASEEKLAAALSRYAGESLRVQISVATQTEPATPARQRDRDAEAAQAAARARLDQDPTVQALQNELGASIFSESVRPNRTEEP